MAGEFDDLDLDAKGAEIGAAAPPPVPGAAELEARTWLTPRQAAQLLQVDYKSVLRWARRREDPLPMRLPPGNCKQGRINRGELDRWVPENWELAS